MNFLPVAARELRLIARRPGTYRARALTALVVSLAGLGMLYAGFGGYFSAGSAGRTLFCALSLTAAVCAIAEGALSTADSLSQEKREGTLGLLFLTDLGGFDIVVGKLVSRAASSLCNLLAALPALGIGLFLGGIMGSDLVRMMAALVNALFFASAWGMLISAVCRSERRATSLAVLGALSLSFVLPAIGWGIGIYRQTGMIESWFVLATPVGALLHALEPRTFGPMLTFSYGDSLWTSHVLGWVFLAGAGVVLSRSWPETTSVSLPQRGRPKPRGSDVRLKPVPGEEIGFVRTIGNRGQSGIGFWPVFMVFSIGWAAGIIFLRNQLLSLPYYAGIVFLLHLSLMFFVLLHACRGPGEDQRGGVLELLLTTPLGESVYVRGRMLTVKRQSTVPLLAVLAVDFGLMVAGCWNTGSLNWEWLGWFGVFSVLALKLLIDLYALAWVGFWQGLKSGNTGRAIRNATFYVLLLKWMVLLGLMALFGIATQGKGFQSAASGIFAVAGYLALFVMTTLHACGLAMSDLRDNLRALQSASSSP